MAHRSPGDAARRARRGRRLPCALLTLLAALGLACATPTRYGHLGPDGGYSERELDDGAWEVTFEGNPDSTSDELRRLLRYRCAELTVASGAEYFVVVRRESLSLPGSAVADSRRAGGWGHRGAGASSGSAEGAAQRAQPRGDGAARPAEAVVIRISRGERPEFGEDARATLRELGPAIPR